MQLLLCLLAYFLFTSGIAMAFYARVKKSGPATSWIQRQENEDRRRMSEICTLSTSGGDHLLNRITNSADRVKDKHRHAELGPSLRIMDGEGAHRGMYPYAAALATDVTFMGWFAHCGATLISRRHLITAAHCIGSKEERIVVLLDGVCIRPGWYDNCTDPTEVMRPVEVDIVLTQYYYFSSRDKLDGGVRA